MQITFPHMGETYIAVKGLLEDLGIKPIIPPECTKETLELGARYAPALACMPFKINLGNYLQSIAKGADTILVVGSCGPCRMGMFWLLQQEILNHLGYQVEIIPLDPPSEDPGAFFQRIRKLLGGNYSGIVKAIINSYRVTQAIDNLNKLIYRTRAREQRRGEADHIIRQFKTELGKSFGSDQILHLINETQELLKKVMLQPQANPIRVGIVGEIYTMIEPFVNLEIEQKLGAMGIEVDRSMTVGGWVRANLALKLLGADGERDVREAARPYIPTYVGGHCQECIGSAVQYAANNYDGIIQLFPFTCMPQIVAKGILPAVKHDWEVPVLTLVVDEMTAEAGYMTRIEAFADLLQQRRL